MLFNPAAPLRHGDMQVQFNELEEAENYLESILPHLRAECRPTFVIDVIYKK